MKCAMTFRVGSLSEVAFVYMRKHAAIDPMPEHGKPHGYEKTGIAPVQSPCQFLDQDLHRAEPHVSNGYRCAGLGWS